MHPPVISPIGIVEHDQHVFEVLEQSVGLLGYLFLDGDARGDLYLFQIFQGQRPAVLDGEPLEGGELEATLDLAVQHSLVDSMLPNLGESDYLLAHGEVGLAQADVDGQHQAVVQVLRGLL